MRLVAAVGWYWFLTGYRTEGTKLSIAAASLDGEVSDEVRAMAYTIVAIFVTSGVGDQYQAREWIHEAHRLTRRGGYRNPLLGFVEPLERMVRDVADFLPAFEPLIADGDPWVRAQARLTRGRLRLTLGGDETDVDADVEIALAEFRALGDRWGISMALTFLADRLAMRGEFARACEHYGEAVTALTEVGTGRGRGRPAGAAGPAVLAARRRAVQHVRHGRSAAVRERGSPGRDALAELALSKAQLARWRGEPDEAHRHLATARAELGDSVRAKALDLYGYLAEDLDQARSYRTEAFRTAVKYTYPPLIAEVLIGLADLALRRGTVRTGRATARGERRGGAARRIVRSRTLPGSPRKRGVASGRPRSPRRPVPGGGRTGVSWPRSRSPRERHACLRGADRREPPPAR
ncbi:hypothetical protein [Streptosporangium vulgare]|uniref:hypothetical protein n=1 Tax=Streptosporangium vulgare TaxID=46190 RepID=UPI0031E2454B